MPHESAIVTRDFIRTMPAARIAALSDRRAGADKEEGEQTRATRTSVGIAATIYGSNQKIAATIAASICTNTRFKFELTKKGAKVNAGF
jgi:hypothetical protein